MKNPAAALMAVFAIVPLAIVPSALVPLATSLFATTLLAAEPAVTVTTPWLRATPNGAPVAGGYATITNKGPAPDRLVGASLPIAAVGEIHSMTMDHGVMHMERLDKGLVIAPGATVTLKPGGYHLMFVKPDAALKEGGSVKGSLTFERAGTIPVTFTVGGMAAKAPPGAAPTDMPGMDMRK